MIKAFIRLIFLMVVPVVLLIFIEAYNPIYALRLHYTKQFFIETHSGTFYLIEKALTKAPQSTWPETFQPLRAHFSYDLRLLPLTRIDEINVSSEIILDGEYVFLDQEPPVLARRIHNSDWIIVMDMDNTEAVRSARAALGSVSLIEHYFRDIPADEYPAALARIQPEYGIDLALRNIDQLQMPIEKVTALQAKEIVWLIDDNEKETLNYRLGDSQMVLIASPSSLTKTNFILVSSGIFIMLFVSSMGLLIWLWPLNRDLKRLDKVSRAFGTGDLGGRVDIRSGSIAARLGHSFNDMADSIQKLIKSNQSITNAVAHDLRTPLARLRFALEILESEDCNEDEKTKYTRSIHNSIDALDYLINQTLQHSRYSRVASKEHFQPCIYADSISNEVDEFSASHQNLIFRLNIDEALKAKSLNVDARALNRALSNLLSNATRYATAKIEVAFRMVGQTLVITVDDDGPGIDKALYSTVFEAFAQLDNTERGSNSGHGLGLAIVNQIATWHKGTIDVDRSPLGGARFSLSWPSQQPNVS